MHIEKASELTEELYIAVQRLVPQLGAHKVPPTRGEMEELIRSQASTLLAAREPDRRSPVVGLLCLTIYRVPTGLRSIIEDVVVDEDQRGRGIGRALVEHAIELARIAGAEGVSLTSNPKREAANRLYRSMGFELRQTNAYFYRLK
ncbi:MAG TPA: GNAT family N-acetyltransferase [Anaerolineales bacterium]|nr:GNAT family N-acetyltransferase [Anaerolineales bacterium]